MTSYSFLSKLLISRQLKFEKGQIILLNRPMAFVPIEFYIHITKEVLKSYKEIREIYLDAWKAGVIFMRDVAEKYSMEKFEERYKNAMDIISSAGFGDYQTLEFEAGKFSHFKILNNPIAEKFYPSKVPVDHILRGFNAGGGTPVHERIINTIETDCKSMNGKFCIHVNATKEILKKYKDQRLVKSQLDLNYLFKKQKAFLKKIKYKKVTN